MGKVLKPGLWGEYFSTVNYSGDPVKKIDGNINFRWREGAPMADVPSDNFSVRWTGVLKTKRSGSHKLILFTEGNAKFTIGRRALTAAGV